MEEQLWRDEDVSFFLSGEEDEHVRREIHDRIKAFNDAVSEAHRRARKPGSVRPLYILLRDREGKLRGGLIADTYWNWLDVDDFWLEESLRGKGLGSKMLQAAEQEAVGRGCRRAKLETFSFQAREFYEKCGYRVVGRLEEYPPGQEFFWMTKNLGDVEQSKA